MGKRLLFTILVIGLLVFTACDEVPTATPASGVSDAEMATLIAIGTEAAVETEEIPPTETPQPVIEPTATETEQPASISPRAMASFPIKNLVSGLLFVLMRIFYRRLINLSTWWRRQLLI